MDAGYIEIIRNQLLWLTLMVLLGFVGLAALAWQILLELRKRSPAADLGLNPDGSVKE